MVSVLLGGCSTSLFGASGAGHGPGGDDDDASNSPCRAPCVADAGAEFDGTAMSAGKHWRYLEDHRDRKWKAMTPGPGPQMTGEDPNNRITTCAAHPTAPACTAVAGGLLVSSSGTT